MQRTRKGLYIIALGVISVMLCIIGLFGVFNKEERVRASAAENTTEYLYFGSGASAMVGDSTDLFKLRFPLYVSENAFTSDATELMLYGFDGDSDTLIDLEESDFGIEKVMQYNNETGEGKIVEGVFHGDIAYIPQEKITFNEEGLAELWVVFYAPFQLEFRARAQTFDGCYATSDARSVVYVWQKSYEAGIFEDEMYAEFLPTVEEMLEFYSDSDIKFKIGKTMLLNERRGLTLNICIPDEYLELLKAPIDIEGGITAAGTGTMTEYYLCITRARTLDGYSAASGSELLTGDGYENYLFAYDVDSRLDKESLQKLPEFSKNVGTISIPMTNDATTEYYYYARIIKRVRVSEYNAFRPWYNTTTDYRYVQDKTTGTLQESQKDIAVSMLARESLGLTDVERTYLQEMAGLATSGDVEVVLTYEGLKDPNDPASMEEKQFTFMVNAAYVQLRSFALSTLRNIDDDLFAFNDISSFNVVYKSKYSEGETIYEMGNRILLTAYGYSYSETPIDGKYYLDVEYNDYSYKDLSIRVKNNDPENPLIMDCYTSEVTTDSTAGTRTITFNFQTIQNNLHNSLKWIFQLSKDSITVNNTGVYANTVTVYVTDEQVKVSYPYRSYGDNILKNLSIVAQAEIIPDFECDTTIKYKSIEWDGEQFVETEVTSEPFKVMYTEIMLYDTWENFKNSSHYAEVLEAVSPAILNGVVYYEPYRVDCPATRNEEDELTGVCEITVYYKYHTLFQIENNYDDTVYFKALNQTSLFYEPTYLYPTSNIPSGYRVEEIRSTSDNVTIKKDESAPDDYTKTTIEVNTSADQKLIIPVTVRLTDKWHVQIEYFETYKETPFALKKTTTTDVSVKDYPDIRALQKSDVQKILGLKTLIAGGIVDVDELSREDITFDGVSTYSVKLTYGKASLRSIDYNGNTREIQIPLTRYVDWIAGMGNDDWTILMLNTKDKQYFKYSNEVERDELYGFFSTAIFEEQVSDLNYYFKNNTGNGCMTIFEQCEVKGSAVYAFFNDVRTGGTIFSVLGHVGMVFCELVNDENHIQQSYFFYLDGSSEYPYLSNGGADDAFDDDNAMENTGQDIVDGVQNAIDQFFGNVGDDPFVKFMRICGGVLVVVAVFGVGVWVLNKLGVIDVFRKGSKPKSKKPKKKSTTKVIKS